MIFDCKTIDAIVIIQAVFCGITQLSYKLPLRVHDVWPLWSIDVENIHDPT